MQQIYVEKNQTLPLIFNRYMIRTINVLYTMNEQVLIIHMMSTLIANVKNKNKKYA